MYCSVQVLYSCTGGSCFLWEFFVSFFEVTVCGRSEQTFHSWHNIGVCPCLISRGTSYLSGRSFALIQPSDIQDMHAQLTLFMDQYDIALPQFPDFDFSKLEAEWTRLRGNIPELWKFNKDGREFQVGEQMKERGLDAKYPVVLIPGVISTVSGAPFRLVLCSVRLSCAGSGVLVDFPRLPTIFSWETMGWIQYAFASHVQPREMDSGYDAWPCHRFGSPRRKNTCCWRNRCG